LPVLSVCVPVLPATQCPMGAFCPGYVNGEFKLPVPLPGWYNLNGSLQLGRNATLFDLCPDSRGIRTRVDRTCVVPCEPSEACLVGNQCAAQYVDKDPMYRCSSCAGGCLLLPVPAFPGRAPPWGRACAWSRADVLARACAA
jgi:hypothetical protein